MFSKNLSKLTGMNLVKSMKSCLRPISLMSTCSRQMSHINADDITLTISNSEFKEIFDNYDPEDNLVLLDVREDEDTGDGFLPEYNVNGVKVKNIRIPILDLIEMQTQEIDPFKESHQILCYCRGGNKSVTATRLLNLHGFSAFNVKGGIKNIKQVMDVWEHGKQNRCLTFILESLVS
jgi:rhodanese-related sulfurtransferase